MATNETSTRLPRLRAVIAAAMILTLSAGSAGARGGSSGSAGAGGGHGGSTSAGGSQHDQGGRRHNHFLGGSSDEIGRYEPSWDPWVTEVKHPPVWDLPPRGAPEAPSSRAMSDPQRHSAPAGPGSPSVR